ncbi:MAG: nickel pincer cofactor biosynthesis protein LarC [Phycisphaerae bacterium]
MPVAYFDCFAGAAGDMIVGSLLDAGADFEALKAHLSRLQVPGYSLSVETVRRAGLAGTKFNVELHAHDHGHRHLADILAIIDSAKLPARAAERAAKVFTRLAEAEAKVHGTGVEQVHFHEVGAVDSIVDIVGACLALELLDIDTVRCSAIPTGRGVIKCDHGVMPIPAPAVARLLVGVPIAEADIDGEATTPTAAAVLTTLAESFGPLPAMDVLAVGCGAGTRDSHHLPNLLRVFIGRLSQGGGADAVVELSANIDDCTGEVLGATVGKLLSAGAVDAWACPLVMKKSRPAWMLSALCSPADVAAMEQIIFSETTTFGIRRHACSRTKLSRRHETVETPYGPIRVKVGSSPAGEITASPEFEDCLAAAASHHVPVREVLASAAEAYRRKGRP